LKLETVEIKLVGTEAELEAAIAVRFRVFVGEQSIPPEEELDEADAAATHAIALCQGKVVGTGRLVAIDNTEDGNGAKIGRMAVDSAWRRHGIGGRILEFLEQSARDQGMTRCVLHAQEYVKGFYAAHGYREQGDTFLEVNIPHVEMWKTL
jgi:predicted GNAT family N-acyltransferase